MGEIVKNSQLYKTLVTSSFNEIYTFDAVSYKFIYLNTSALNNLGYTIEEMIKLTPLDIKPDYDTNTFEKLILPLRNKKKRKIQFYTNHKRKDGTLYPVEIYLQLNSYGKTQYFSAFVLDITERKELEINLLESNNIINLSPVVVFKWETKNKWNTKFVTENVIDLLGYSASDFLKNKVLYKNLIHQEDFNRVEKEILNYYKTNQKKKLIQEYRVITKEGTIKWVRDFPSIKKNKDHNNYHFTAILEDITDYKEAEFALKVSKANLLKAQEAANLGSWIIDIKNNTIVWSKQVYKIFGVTLETPIDYEQFLKLVHPEDRDYVAEKWNNAVTNTDEPYDIEHRIVIDNKIKWVRESTDLIFDEKENPISGVGIVQDITKQKIQEIKLRKSEKSLLEAQRLAKIGSYNLNLKTNIVETSAVFNEIVGIDSNCVLTFALWRTITYPEDTPTNQKALEKCLKTGENFDLKYRILTKNTKEVKWVHGLGEVFYINGEPEVFFGTIQDITQEKMAQFDLENAYAQVEELKNHLEEENISLKKEITLSFNYEDMVYSSVEFSEVLTQVEQVSCTDATVLILGETGTGKELITKAIHNTSDRKDKPLIRINCAAIPTELIESELFGHIKGAFTGAINNRIGKFELANKGTLFLDEIGEMPLALQPKLLRAIQEGEIEPIGSSKTLKLDVRIIAATNRDLKKEVRKKRFREDLYFRLNVFPITVPPLRERIEDIPVLIDYFVKKYCKKYGKEIKYVSESTLKEMKSYNWPGNVRELENLIERAAIISNEDCLIIKEFNNDNYQIKKTIIKHTTTLEEVQRNHIIKILEESQWKIEGKEGAAVKLSIKPSTLRDRMKKLGIVRSKNNHAIS